MKRITVFVLSACLVLSLCACSGKVDAPETNSPSITDPPTAEHNTTEPNNTHEATITEPTEEKIDVEWTEYSYTTTDSAGYTYEITYELSPWILMTNTEIAESVWEEVGNGNDLATNLGSWGLEKSGNYVAGQIPNGGTTKFWGGAMTDMYYCMGTVKIVNLTEGWDITSDNTRSVSYGLSWQCNYSSSNIFAIGKTFFSNNTSLSARGLNGSARMTKNAWGAVPFIIMAPENMVPNAPNGEYAEIMPDGYFDASYDSSDDKIYIGVIGKDGIYIPPSEQNQ